VKLIAAAFVLVVAVLSAWLGVPGSGESVVGAAPRLAPGPTALLADPVGPADSGPHRATLAEAVPDPEASGHALAEVPQVVDALDDFACVEEFALAGLVLHPRAADVDFEIAFAARSRAERVLARHRIRKLFQKGIDSPGSLGPLIASADELEVLARQMQWLSAKLAAEPVDPFKPLALAGAGLVPEDEAALCRRYAGQCDEELALELDRLERARAAENDRGLDECIALGLHRIRHQAAEF